MINVAVESRSLRWWFRAGSPTVHRIHHQQWPGRRVMFSIRTWCRALGRLSDLSMDADAAGAGCDVARARDNPHTRASGIGRRAHARVDAASAWSRLAGLSPQREQGRMVRLEWVLPSGRQCAAKPTGAASAGTKLRIAACMSAVWNANCRLQQLVSCDLHSPISGGP